MYLKTALEVINRYFHKTKNYPQVKNYIRSFLSPVKKKQPKEIYISYPQ